MRRIFVMLILLLTSAVQGQDVSPGFRVGLNNTIGTGKGYWDWTTGSQVQRQISPSFILSGLVLWQITPYLSLESGLTYGDNICSVKVDSEEYIYKQPSLEIPLTARLYYTDRKLRPYGKAGGSFITLMGDSSFKSQSSDEDLFDEPRAGNLFHGGLILGFGLENRDRKDHRYFLEFLYSTFYTSPEYARTDGTLGNIRFHRFELGGGFLF